MGSPNYSLSSKEDVLIEYVKACEPVLLFREDMLIDRNSKQLRRFIETYSKIQSFQRKIQRDLPNLYQKL